MIFFKKLFVGDKNPVKTEQSIAPRELVNVEPEYKDEYDRLGLVQEIDTEEEELVSVIASAIFVGDNSDVKVKVKSVRGIDVDKINAIAAVSAVAAGDYPNSVFRLVSIREINK